MNGIWVSLIRSRASSGANHSTRSISGTVIHLPERGGHSSGNVLLSRGRRVEVALERPRLDELAALLLDLPELDRVAVGRRVTGLLLEFATRHRPGRLAVVELALGHGPDARVALRPERSAGMGEQHLDVAVGSAAVQQEPGAPARRSLVVETSGRCGRGASARTSVRPDRLTGCRSAPAGVDR